MQPKESNLPEGVEGVDLDESPKTNEASKEPKIEICEKCKVPIRVVKDLEACWLNLANVAREIGELKKERMSRFRTEKKAAEIYEQLSILAKAEMEALKPQNPTKSLESPSKNISPTDMS